MNWKRHFAEAATLVAAAVLCALVANSFAARERKLALPGDYPNATTVPPRVPAEAPPVEAAAPPSPAPVAAASPAPAPTAAMAAPKAAPVVTPAKKAASPAMPTPAPAPAAERLTGRFPPHPDKPYTEISGSDVAWLRDRGALVLDARRSSVYQEGHIAGALSFPVWEAAVVDPKVEALVAEGRDPKQPVVLYCSGGDCEDSHMLAQKLFGAGFENLLVYRDGWPDWVKRGGAAKTGAAP